MGIRIATSVIIAAQKNIRDSFTKKHGKYEGFLVVMPMGKWCPTFEGYTDFDEFFLFLSVQVF
jgi:hypothetical protein